VGKLIEARGELLRCSQQGCPRVVTSDCLPWLGEVEQAIPSIVVAAKGVDGKDTAAVRVLVDGVLAAPTLDGTPIALDPGPHRLRFEHGAAPAIEQDIVIQVGARARPVDVSFAPKQAAQGAPAAPTAAPAIEQPEGRGAAIAGYVLTGVGVLGLGSFALFGLMGKHEADGYDETCAPTKTCDPDEVDATRTKLIVADVSLGVGLAALGVGIGLILYDQLSGPDDPGASARIDLVPRPGGGAATLAVSF
jgi:hypothetical protein